MSTADDNFDSEADATILACLNVEKPRSFFLYAGAGSGKTRLLVEAIRAACKEQGRRLSLSGQKVGVITYTNSACDEIKQRLEFDPRVEVSTIHAFAWSLIAAFDSDIRGWLALRLLPTSPNWKKRRRRGGQTAKPHWIAVAQQKASGDVVRTSLKLSDSFTAPLGTIIREISSATQRSSPWPQSFWA